MWQTMFEYTWCEFIQLVNRSKLDNRSYVLSRALLMSRFRKGYSLNLFPDLHTSEFRMLTDLYPCQETSCQSKIYGPTVSPDIPGWNDWPNNQVSYGNGLIKFIEKSFCSNGVCNNVTVCQTVDVIDGTKYYVPLRVDTANRRSKELDKNENLMK